MTITELWDEKGRKLDIARHPLQIVQFKSEFPVHPNNMMRKEIAR
jgi:putative protease